MFFRPTINTRSHTSNNVSANGPVSEHNLPPSYRAPQPHLHRIAPPTHIADYQPSFTSSTLINHSDHTALTHPHSLSSASEDISTITSPTKFSQICEVVAQITSDNPSRESVKDPTSTLDIAAVVCPPSTPSSCTEGTNAGANRKGDLVSIVTISGCTESESSPSEMNVLAHL